MSYSSLHAKAQAAFDPAPSILGATKKKVHAATSVPKSATCVGALISTEGDVPSEFGIERAALTAAGFKAKVGEAMVVPRNDGPAIVFVGAGARGSVDANSVRDAAAAFARATSGHQNLALLFPEAS